MIAKENKDEADISRERLDKADSRVQEAIKTLRRVQTNKRQEEGKAA